MPRKPQRPTASGDEFYGPLLVTLGTPGAVVERIELADGIAVEINGAGSPVRLSFPYGIDGMEAVSEW